MVRTHSAWSRNTRTPERPSYFRRNAAQWDALEHCIMPWLIDERAPTPDRPLRIWSAGCATGEEAFDVAITAQRVLGPRALESVAILGTDRCAESIASARRGRFPGDAFRGTTLDYRRRFFARSDERLAERVVGRNLAAMIRFEQLDLCDTQKIERVQDLDVLLCRNVIDELPAGQRAAAWCTLRGCVRRGGYLILGEPERRLGADSVATVQWRDALIHRAC